MLGQDLVPALRPRYKVVSWDIEDIDITQAEETLDKIRAIQPRVVINCAAYTDVDGCESRTDQAFSVNAEGAKNVAKACAAIRARMIHFSTDYVFDGSSSAPYKEEDPVNPQSTYGRSKLKGERWIRETWEDHLIIRTAWLYGAKGKNFVEAILRQANIGKELRVVNDQRGAPTFTKDLSRAVEEVFGTSYRGYLHITNSDFCTWFEFARRILNEQGLKDISIRPISTADLGRAANRPAYSVLDCSRYEKVSGHKMRKWGEALKDYIRERKEGEKNGE